VSDTAGLGSTDPDAASDGPGSVVGGQGERVPGPPRSTAEEVKYWRDLYHQRLAEERAAQQAAVEREQAAYSKYWASMGHPNVRVPDGVGHNASPSEVHDLRVSLSEARQYAQQLYDGIVRLYAGLPADPAWLRT
jgi:hypothetical protein